MFDLNLLKTGLKQLKIEATEQQLNLIQKFYHLYQEWNAKIDLSSITDAQDFITKHVLDSAAALSHFLPGKKIADLGSGGGFPGIILKILNPALNISLLEVIQKKVNYLKEVNEQLQLQLKIMNPSREKIPADFDLITCRAFGSLKKIHEQARKILKNNGKIIAYKARKEKIQEEQKEFHKKIQILPLVIPFLDGERNLVILENI